MEPDAVVLRQRHPVSCADVAEPFLVFRVLRKVVVVNFYFFTRLTQRLGDGLSPE